MPYAMNMRVPAPRVKPRVAQPTSFPAPTGGWVANQNLAAPDPRAPQSAYVLDNIFPTATGSRLRRGSQKYATLGAGSADVQALFSYVNGNNSSLFASLSAAIYDITAVADPDVSPSPAVGSLSSGDWVSVQFATSGGVFLRLVNGFDDPRVYDGAAWGTSPAITGSGLTASDLNYVWAFKNRLFFIEAESLNAWYLPVDSIGGTATIFPMGGIFTLGGSLLFGASWSLDTGGGLSEQCVFITTEGEVAVFQGANPGSASEWQKVGVYKIGRPLGKKAHMRAGGDLIVATDIGYVPLSQAIARDTAALAPAAVSYPIEAAWNEAVAQRSFAPWHCAIWPTAQTVLIAMPANTDYAPQMFVANARTGAWARYTGWNGTCLAVFGDRAFFGSTNGRVMECEVTGADDGMPYVSVYVPLFTDLGNPLSEKIPEVARVVYRSTTEIDLSLSAQFDYNVNLPAAPDATPITGEGLWGTGIWGETSWGEEQSKSTFQAWESVAGIGYAVSVALQITNGSLQPPDVDLIRLDLTFDTGDIIS